MIGTNHHPLALPAGDPASGKPNLGFVVLGLGWVGFESLKTPKARGLV